jgi:hypothetical protein
MNSAAVSTNPLSQNNFYSPAPVSPASSFPSLTSASSDNGWFSHFDWRVWLFIIFILAFLGINIFVYLAQGTQTIADLIAPITQYFGGTAINATKQAVNVSATGAKTGIDVAAGTVTTGLDVVQQTAGSIKGAPASDQQTTTSISDNSLSNALNNATSSLNQKGGQQQSEQDIPTYHADDSYSSIQASKTAGKAGWCFIGEDRGFRSCIEVGENDQCMSGDIFPSQEICVNPTLRM